MSICLMVCRHLRTTSKILCLIFGKGWSNILHAHALYSKFYWLQILIFILRKISPSLSTGQIFILNMLKTNQCDISDSIRDNKFSIEITESKIACDKKE